MSLLLARRLLLCLLFIFCLAVPAGAALEIRVGEHVTVINEVYQRDGAAFVAIDDVLAALGGSGRWESVSRRYLFSTPRGQAAISPGSSFLQLGERQIKLSQRPRFIDGRLRVAEPFVRDELLKLYSSEARLTDLSPAPPAVSEAPVDKPPGDLLVQHPADDGGRWVVALDPGHGGEDPGVLGRDGTTEQGINLAVAVQLQKLLKMLRSDPVLLTRDGDYAVPPERRLELLRGGQPDLLLLLHCQASFSPQPRGVILYIAPPEPTALDEDVSTPRTQASRQLAEALRQALSGAGFKVAAVAERDLLPLGQGNLPRVLIEMGYLSHPEELAALKDPAWQEKLARALFAGVESFRTTYPSLQETDDATEPPPAQR